MHLGLPTECLLSLLSNEKASTTLSMVLVRSPRKGANIKVSKGPRVRSNLPVTNENFGLYFNLSRLTVSGKLKFWSHCHLLF